jgi:alpha-D-ribose 1-methylphosphonate 5-triphosphate synthase subunit PhnG
MSVTNSHDRDDTVAAQDFAQRRAAMAVLAKAATADIARGLNAVASDVDFTDARPAEIGLVMLRGRIGGGGAPFNIGEATVTRAAVQLASGETGFGYVLGRDREKARLAALCDALWQIDAKRQPVEDHIIAPLRQQQLEKRALARAQTAATRVDFFTLVRGEDER